MGYLCRSLPYYVQKPPIEAVVFGWGVNEDGQLVSVIVQALELACHNDSLHSAPALLHAEALHRGCYVLAGLNKDIQLVSLIPPVWRWSAQLPAQVGEECTVRRGSASTAGKAKGMLR